MIECFPQTTEDSIKTIIDIHYLAIKTHNLTLLNTVHYEKMHNFHFSQEDICTDSIGLNQITPMNIEEIIRLNEFKYKNNIIKKPTYLLGDVEVIVTKYYCKNKYPPLSMWFSIRRLTEGWKILEWSYISDENYPSEPE